MKVCTVEHHAPGFGLVPVGSLWADDSPYAAEADCFAPVEDFAIGEAGPETITLPAGARVVKPRKFAAKPEGDDAA